MIITRAPLRISLGGGGTDLPSYYSRYGGFVVSGAIDKYVFVSLNRLKIEDFIRVKYSETELVESPDQIEHPLLREALKLTAINKGVEIASMADVPAGTGLGSSGSFLVSLLMALHVFKNEHISVRDLAEEACKIEIDIVGQPVGKHDQYLAALGGLTCLNIDRNGKVEVSSLKISPHHLDQLQNSILLFYTGILRRSSAILSDQKADTDKGRREVVDSLHLTKELGLKIKETLEMGNLDHFGELLDVHWQNKKKRSWKISNSNIDKWYEIAKENGALGGKILGAGGGGFFMFYCPSEHKAKLRTALTREGLREMSSNFDHEGVKVLANFESRVGTFF